MSEKIIYLAGKVHTAKWLIAKRINEILPHCRFICSDEHGDEEHGMIQGFGSFVGLERRQFIESECLDKIHASEMVVAYLDTPDSFGSVAEIAFASALDKPCYVGILVPPTERDPYELQWHKHEASENESRFLAMHDAYWFISHFPRVTAFSDSAEMLFDLLLGVCKIESPIEHLFYRHAYPRFGHLLQPQYPIGKYRTDFAIASAKLAIEIDGHAYHSSKEQRTYDAQRDRAFTVEGWTVIRFTGSEVFKQPEQCAIEALTAYRKKHPIVATTGVYEY